MKTMSLLAGAFAAAAALTAASQASAAIATFEDGRAFSCDSSTQQSSGGLTYTQGFYACYYSGAAPADFPTTLTSEVMAVGFSDTLFTRDDDSLFDLQSLDLAFGPFFHNDATSDTTFVTGYLAGGGTVTRTLTVGYGFQHFTFDDSWKNLTSVNFGQLTNSEYLAFDNIAYQSGAVPEAGTWALMILGFGAAGAALRGQRRKRAPA